MNEKLQEIIKQVGTDVSGKWISVDNAEKFAQLLISEYNKELKESRRETQRELGYSRIGLRNIWKNTLQNKSSKALEKCFSMAWNDRNRLP